MVIEACFSMKGKEAPRAVSSGSGLATQKLGAWKTNSSWFVENSIVGRHVGKDDNVVIVPF